MARTEVVKMEREEDVWDDYVFHHPHYGQKLSKLMYSLFKTKSFCDIVLVVEEEKISCHKVVLCASSPYFHTMFGSSFMESTANEVNLASVSSLVIRPLLMYIYTGVIQITEENCEELLKVSDMMSFNDLKEEVSSYMCRTVNVDNCLRMWKMARMLRSEGLQNMAFEYALENFSVVSEKCQFLQLEEADIIEYVSSSLLACTSEDHVCKMLLKWVDVHIDKLNRAESCGLSQFIFKTIRLQELSASFIKTYLMKNEHISRERSFCQTLDAVHDHLCYATPLPSDVPLSSPRLRTAMHTILCFGYYPSSSVLHIHLEKPWDVSTQEKTQYHMSSLTEGSWRGVDGCVVQNNVYICGRKDVELWKYDSSLFKWIQYASLPVRRKFHRVVADAMGLYVVGGCEVHRESGKCVSTVDSIYYYSFARNSWTRVGYICEAVCLFAVCYYNKKIYIFGGFSEYSDDGTDQNTNKIQVFDTDSQQPHTLSTELPLSADIPGSQAVLFKDKMIVFGRDKSAVFTLKKGKSGEFEETVTTLGGTGADFFGLQAVGNLVFLFGGTRDGAQCDIVKALDINDVVQSTQSKPTWKLLGRLTLPLEVAFSCYVMLYK